MPVTLAEKCIRAGCPPEGVVLDPFVGTGTTLVAATNLGRSGLGIDASEPYIHEARRRLADASA